MPNWCSTDYYVTLEKKYASPEELAAARREILKFWLNAVAATNEDTGTDFKKGWLGNIYLKSGYTMEDIDSMAWIRCRGSIDDINLHEGDITGEIRGVCLCCETAWEPMMDSFSQLLEEKYPGLRLLVRAEEPGECIYINTDTDGEFFYEKYKIASDDEDSYYEVGEDKRFLEDIEACTGIKFATVKEALCYDEEELCEAYQKYQIEVKKTKADPDDLYFYLHEYISC